MRASVTWPAGKSFAFTIFDDTDDAQLPDIKLVYDFLADIGIRSTKSIWPIKGELTPLIGGSTCEDRNYLDWVLDLQRSGFEIGLHNVTYHTSPREKTICGINKFRELFGHNPYTLANHAGCDESIYWGNARLSGWREKLYNVLLLNRHKKLFQGHIENSPLFWGDVCKTHIEYVRNFVFGGMNTLKSCPFMPYHDPLRPYVNGWFASSEGPSVESFNQTISESAQDRLLAEGGACIMYTHFARGFSSHGQINPRFKVLMERLSRTNGWFVPVKNLLDHLRGGAAIHSITSEQRDLLERRWLLHRFRTFGST